MEALSELILRRQWTQVKAAEMLGLTQPRISAIKNLRYDQLSVSRLIKVMTTLGYEFDFKYGNNRISSHLNQRKGNKTFSPVLLSHFSENPKFSDSPDKVDTIMCESVPSKGDVFLICAMEDAILYSVYECTYCNEAHHCEVDGHIAHVRGRYLGRTEDETVGIGVIGYPF